VDRIVISDASARARLVEIWDEARQAGLNKESLIAYIDSMEVELAQSQELNFLRWPIMQTRVHQNPRTWGTYAKEVQNVRRFMGERMDWMDKRLGYTFIPNAIAEVSIDDHSPSDVSLDFSKLYEVFTLSGMACGHSLEGLRHGTYIVRQGGKGVLIYHN
jgi:hypothetical protein